MLHLATLFIARRIVQGINTKLTRPRLETLRDRGEILHFFFTAKPIGSERTNRQSQEDFGVICPTSDMQVVL